MLIIIKNGELTEKKKEETCKYYGWFKLINKMSKLIAELEEVDEYLTPNDEYEMTRYKVKEIEEILDKAREDIEYARKSFEKNKPVWAGGDITRLIKE